MTALLKPNLHWFSKTNEYYFLMNLPLFLTFVFHFKRNRMRIWCCTNCINVDFSCNIYFQDLSGFSFLLLLQDALLKTNFTTNLKFWFTSSLIDYYCWILVPMQIWFNVTLFYTCCKYSVALQDQLMILLSLVFILSLTQVIFLHLSKQTNDYYALKYIYFLN